MKIYELRIGDQWSFYSRWFASNELTVGMLLDLLKDVDPDKPVNISTTADCGYIGVYGPVHDVCVEEDCVVFHSEEEM